MTNKTPSGKEKDHNSTKPESLAAKRPKYFPFFLFLQMG